MKCECIGWRYICPVCQARADQWEASLKEHAREYSPEIAEVLRELKTREEEIEKARNKENAGDEMRMIYDLLRNKI